MFAFTSFRNPKQIRHNMLAAAAAIFMVLAASWLYFRAIESKPLFPKPSATATGAVAKKDSLQNPDSTINTRFLMGMNPNFVTMVDVPVAYCSKPLKLQKAVWEAYLLMHTAAKAAGIQLTIISGMRDFNYQKGIWNGKYGKLAAKGITGEAAVRNILKYSSMPGTSRHHWGTDMDLNSLEPGFFLSGDGLKMLTWMRLHAGEFGFCEVYSPRSTGRTTGYEPEPWHWSYMPLAKQYLQQYKDKIGYNLIQGDPSMKKVSGILYANKVRIKEDFIQGINQCQ